MIVLSLFDGISCGRVALERAGIPVTKYYASEIDKYAISVSKKNYPDIVHVGDICNLRSEDFKDVDLIIGGSPCTNLLGYLKK
jgi:site-specific DNA-cytosine methylase